MSGNLIQNSISRRDFYGDLILKDKEIKISGYVLILAEIPVEGQIKLTPQDGSDPLNFEYKLQTKEDKSYALFGSITHLQKFTRFRVQAIPKEKLDWQFDLQVNIIICSKQNNIFFMF